ncbi:hypothetical protein [Shewanella algae]|uniref:hypothetical protein n=1 Tax=Shewanella algae TaxID=38313 RepID=UPI0011A05A5F|nr:hypothetical protein [Shewanella algae]
MSNTILLCTWCYELIYVYNPFVLVEGGMKGMSELVVALDKASWSTKLVVALVAIAAIFVAILLH